MIKVLAASLLTVAILTSTGLAEDTQLPSVSAKANVTYESDIKPIFEASCVKCHSGDHAKAKLHMDTLAGVLKGSKEGPILKAGNSAKSWIVLVTAHATDDDMTWMPPVPNKAGIKPLTSDQIGIIRAWIDQGAK